MLALGKVGYSLVELLMAMTLFTIAALGLSAGVVLVSRSGVLSTDLTRASLLAQEKIEELADHTDALVGGTDNPQSRFTRVWSVAPDTPATGVTKLTVEVSWEGNDAQAVSLVTVVNE
jgi:prepilin-type N-terminal cleavage/methylation domain-containing protein